jgi:hypothetical protein
MKHTIVAALSAISLASCNTTNDTAAATDVPPPPVNTALVGTGEPMGPDSQPAYCRGEVAAMYGTKPSYVTTLPIIMAGDGSSTIRGTVDKGSAGTKTFKCRFDAAGRFIDVMATKSDSE